VKGQLTFQKIVDRFSEVKILVVGDVMMDRFIWGKVSRISPEAPVPVVLFEREDLILGGAANVVNNIHSLGGDVSICGVVGNDEYGKIILEKINEIGVKTDGIFEEKGRRTTVKTRIIAHQHPYQQQLARIDRETTDHSKPYTSQSLLKFLSENIDHFDGIIISDYGKGVMTKKLSQAIIQKAKRYKKFVMVDPKPKNFSFYKGATLITPNAKEAGDASGVPVTDLPSLKKAGRILLDKSKCNVLIITQGEEGMTVFESFQNSFPVPTVAKDVYDVTGAGDTVIGTLALAWGAGAKVKEAAMLANYAAGIVVGKMGTATATREELIRVIKRKF
jgi:D-beta-D-heptose 7-phosphate kinase/D-beta-D-heptose 1-phosphate adenosyltransferase